MSYQETPTPTPGAKQLVVLAMLAMFGATGCSSDLSDLEQKVREANAQPPGQIEPLPELKPYESFQYSATHLRSPFEAMHYGAMDTDTGPAMVDTGIQPDFNRPREPLEMYPLDSLRMAGTLALSEQTWGLVRTNDGTLYRVKLGSHLGQNHGEVIGISETEIALIEIVPNGMGGWIEREAALTASQ